MTHLVIAYDTGAGHTRLLAEIIAEGANAEGATVTIVDVAEAIDWDALNAAQAIVFGSPTFMGTVSAPFKAFMDATSDFWTAQPWRDKLAAGYTVGSSPSGDKVLTIVTLATFAAQHGMLWIGQAEIGPPSRDDDLRLNADGFSLGLGVTNARDKSVMIEAPERDTARLFGARIAIAAKRWG